MILALLNTEELEKSRWAQAGTFLQLIKIGARSGCLLAR